MSLFHTLKFVANHPLNRERRIGSLIGFVKWQIGSRLAPGPIVYSWIEGSRFIVTPGETGLTGDIYCGLHEFSEMAYLLHVIGPDDLFVDIGSNVGSYTILACAVKGAKGYCFEPVPATFRRLMDNIRINDLSNRVKAFNVGIADKEGELVFTAGENCTNHVIPEGEKSTDVVRVKVLPLDTILEGQTPSALKIDVEGLETLVLRGAQVTLHSPSLHSVIMELNGIGTKRYGFSEDEILKTMKGYGFSTYIYEPFSKHLESLDGKQNAFGNALFIRDERVVQDIITKSSPVRIGHTLL